VLCVVVFVVSARCVLCVRVWSVLCVYGDCGSCLCADCVVDGRRVSEECVMCICVSVFLEFCVWFLFRAGWNFFVCVVFVPCVV